MTPIKQMQSWEHNTSKASIDSINGNGSIQSSIDFVGGPIFAVQGGVASDPTQVGDPADLYVQPQGGNVVMLAPNIPNTKAELNVNGNIHVKGNGSINGNVRIGLIPVSYITPDNKTATTPGITANLSINGDITATGKANVNGDANVSGNVTVNGDITASGKANVTGNVNVSGDVNVNGDVKLIGGDCAEDFDIAQPENVDAGTVMVINDEGTLQQSGQAYDKRVAGIISGAGDLRPGVILGKQSTKSDRMPLALVGKVYCKVDAGYSSIGVGDLLTTSPTPGHAMKAKDQALAFGAVIGKALSRLEGGKGLIPVLVALQ